MSGAPSSAARFREEFQPTSVRAAVDVARRRNIERNHSATHLVHAALRKYLGTHVHQQGSLVDDGRLRFDFSHHGPIEPDMLQQIEREVNARIWENLPVETREMAYPDALALGAMAFFSEKYGDVVRVVSMGDSVDRTLRRHARPQHRADRALPVLPRRAAWRPGSGESRRSPDPRPIRWWKRSRAGWPRRPRP